MTNNTLTHEQRQLLHAFAHVGYNYTFDYVAGNPEDGVFQNSWEIETNHPMDAAWIERTWGQIAEEEQFVVRGEVTVAYPRCNVWFKGQPF